MALGDHRWYVRFHDAVDLESWLNRVWKKGAHTISMLPWGDRGVLLAFIAPEGWDNDEKE